MPLAEALRNPADLRVAIVGYGSIGRRHYENLGHLGVKQRMLVRTTPRRPGSFADPPDAAIYSDLTQLTATKPDLAIVANPTSLHIETAQTILAAGVPVLVEKPLAHDLTQAVALVEAAEACQAAAGMAYPLRYHPAYRLARDYILQRQLGRILYAKAWFESYLPDWHPWEDYRASYAARRQLGGGAALTLDHELDFLNWCLGDATQGQGWRETASLDIDCDDLAMLLLRYPGGIPAQVSLAMCRRDRTRGFEIVGSKATLRYHEPPRRLELLGPGEHVQVLWNGADYETNTMYLDMLGDALAVMCRPGPRSLPIPLTAGLAALRAATWAVPVAVQVGR